MNGLLQTYQLYTTGRGATGTLGFLVGSASEASSIVGELSRKERRKQTQALLKEFNPEDRTFSGDSDLEKLRQLRDLISYKKNDLSRSNRRLAADHVDNAKILTETGLNATYFGVVTAWYSGSQIAIKAFPGVAIVANSVALANSSYNTGKHIITLNNLAKADAASNDPLLHALSEHIRNERSIGARKALLDTAVNTANLGVSIGFAASGAGSGALFFVSGGFGLINAAGQGAFDHVHNKGLKKQRAESDLLIGHSKKSREQLAQENIGVAEKLFLYKLRFSSGEELKESVDFLRGLGVSDKIIAKIQLEPETDALKTVQKTIYKDRVQFQSFMA